MLLIGLIGWVVCGAILGFTASKFVNLRGDDPRLGIAVSALASVVGGWLYTIISGSGVSAFNIWSILCAILAAAIALVVWHIVRSKGSYTVPSFRRSY